MRPSLRSGQERVRKSVKRKELRRVARAKRSLAQRRGERGGEKSAKRDVGVPRCPRVLGSADYKGVAGAIFVSADSAGVISCLFSALMGWLVSAEHKGVAGEIWWR